MPEKYRQALFLGPDHHPVSLLSSCIKQRQQTATERRRRLVSVFCVTIIAGQLVERSCQVVVVQWRREHLGQSQPQQQKTVLDRTQRHHSYFYFRSVWLTDVETPYVYYAGYKGIISMFEVNTATHCQLMTLLLLTNCVTLWPSPLTFWSSSLVTHSSLLGLPVHRYRAPMTINLQGKSPSSDIKIFYEVLP